LCIHKVFGQGEVINYDIGLDIWSMGEVFILHIHWQALSIWHDVVAPLMNPFYWVAMPSVLIFLLAKTKENEDWAS
jgi:hypothetical protein